MTSAPATANSAVRYPGGRTGVLLIHGLGGTPAEMVFVARGLARAGFTVECCQLAGHCGTEADLLATGWRDWYASVEAALDGLRRQCDVVIAGGLSMGAILGVHLAAQHPECVDGLALYSPTLRYDGWAIPWTAFLLRPFIFTPWAKRYKFTERPPYGLKDERIRRFVLKGMEMGRSAEAGLMTKPSASLREFWTLVDIVKRELRRVRTPALIVHPRHDDIADLRNTMYLQRHLGGLVETVVLEDSYHIVTIDRQRDVVIDRTAAFATRLQEQAAKRAPRLAAE